ncbi:MAG TPA: branched-chain amino acid ABC transporter substrate-binding protein [Gaiellaceae bacterium]|jgi:branched-chain amino acid transport system substrate-binding protein|nr:branched-chain amino acid ABC transporter substrate-binding protein [Gaiellaceae bacterium]
MKKAVLLVLLTASLAATAAAFSGSSNAGPDRVSAADRAQIRCGRTRTIGVAAPITGAAASIGSQQLRWAKFFVSRYNATHRRTKFRVVQGDTQLPDTAQAIQVAERFASNSRILGVVGPAGSQEVQVSTASLKGSGLGFVSGSATRTTLTTDKTRRGFFFRTVPNDDQQGPRVAGYIRSTLNATRVVVVDAQNSYSTGLSDTVEQILRRQGLSVRRESVSEANTTDFSSLVARIPGDTQVVYIPWQLAPKAQLFGQQLRAAGKSARLFGSDGLFDPDNFKIPGSLISFFPIDLRARTITAYRRGPGRGSSELFGLPSHEATKVVARAIDRACRNGTATRREVRLNIARTNIPRAQSLLGFPIRFVSGGTFPLGPGDMQRPADFGIYRIQPNGTYVRVA